MPRFLELILWGVVFIVVAAGAIYINRPQEEVKISSTGADTKVRGKTDTLLPALPEAQDGATLDFGEAVPPPGFENINEPEQVEEPVRQRQLAIPKITNTIRATIKTSKGDILVELYGEKAPETVGSFAFLAKENFYDNTAFHRVIPDFMIQGGDPLSQKDELKARWGSGGPNYKFRDEINDRKLVRGSLAMANAGPNTNGSQFFIVTADAVPHLDGKHTNFGEVVEGMGVVDAISQVERDERDNPLEKIVVSDILVQE